MLIELLIVGVIMTYLYSAGWIEFNSPYAIPLTLAVVAVCATVGWVITHFVAHGFVNSLFGFNAWTPRKPLQSSGGAPGSAQMVELGVLERLVGEAPRDRELSRRLAEEYLRRGLLEESIAERLRIVEVGQLRREEVCSILNRVADIELKRGEKPKALETLQRIVAKYPDCVEAVNAKRRIAVISGDSASPEDNR